MIPLSCFSTNSPTINKVITCNPSVRFEMMATIEECGDILIRIEEIKEDTEGYILLDVLRIYIEEPLEKIEWNLSIPIIIKHEPFVLIIDSEAIIKQEISIAEKGTVITDFTDYEPNIYYICFYIKDI